MTNDQHQPPRQNPYVGPRPYISGEAFYGRDRELYELANLVISERIVVLISPSGAGKTSLLRVLMHHLIQESFLVMPFIRVGNPVLDDFNRDEQTNRYLLSVIQSIESGLHPADQMAALDLRKLSLDEYLTQREPLYQPDQGEFDAPVLFVFDQLEEILYQDPLDLPGKLEFFQQLGQALRRRHRFAILSLREDYLAPLYAYQRYLPGHLRVTYRLELLDMRASLQAIVKPMQREGIEFPEALAMKLVDDLRRVRVEKPDGSVVIQAGLYIEPVQLQVVCRQLWENLPPGTDTVQEGDIASIGEVDQTLADYYDQNISTIASKTGFRENIIRTWFERQLITPGGLRAQVLMGAEQSAGLDNLVIRLLEDAHLVRREKRRDLTWIELANDRLVEPVRSSNSVWFETHSSQLRRQAITWDQEGRLYDLLLVGVALREAEAWAENHPGELTSIDQEFLKASLQANSLQQSDRLKRLSWVTFSGWIVAVIALLLLLWLWLGK